GFGLKDGVTPLGRPDADKLTLALKPLWGMTVMVVVALVPCAMVKLGDAKTVKFGGGGTVRVIAIVFVKLPDVPVIVTVTVPVVPVLLAVSLTLRASVAGFGLKDGVTPLGRPDADKLTLPLKTFSGVIVIVVVPLAPCVMVKLLGDAERINLGGAAGQLFTRLAALTVPIPVAKSQPVAVPYAGLYELLEVESTPSRLESKKQ